jgi:hypothetical protein
LALLVQELAKGKNSHQKQGCFVAAFLNNNQAVLPNQALEWTRQAHWLSHSALKGLKNVL